MSDISMKSVYANLIAGRLPVGSASALRVVGNHAYAILGTNRLHVHITVRSGYVYYFAVESRWMGSSAGTLIPFIDCLPGKPQHQGDGIYLLSESDYSAALIIEAGNLQFLCNDSEILSEHLLGLDLPIHPVKPGGGEVLSSIPQAILGVSERVGGWVQKVSMAILAGSTAIFLGIHVFGAVQSSLNAQHLNVRAVENDLNATLEKVSIQQPLAMQISRIQQVSATVVRSGGWIEQYHLQGEHREQFEIVLPSWVSQDYLDQLGRDVVTDLRDLEGLLTVRKTVVEKK
ncbi:hypothetical protein NQT62_14115 [Limnobacter humi]|uniref:Uncharacterized protein n=1 Tax=Limnobacter humi TaxID=1778671 RepID=A0ABT1WJ74_9BURK|nr:hypothetical protein [Limnobacter humi]MCQ8897573.1 hypothetical protein [Limnobacter humi]